MNMLSHQIKSIRDKREMTQAELASRAGMLPAQLCRIENGRTDPTVGTTMRIAEALGMTLSELLHAGGGTDSVAYCAEDEAGHSANHSKDTGTRTPREKHFERSILVRCVPHSVEAFVRKAIAVHEARYEALDLRCGVTGTTSIQLSYPFVRDERGAETLARVLRDSLGLGEATIADLPGVLELHGVRIHFVAFRGEESSVSFYDVVRNTLSIVVRRDDTPERQTYRLVYELGAACMFASEGMRTVADTDARHRFLRQFAAAFLMPEDGVRKVVAQCGLMRREWTMSSLLALKVRFNVSAEAFALRLEALGLILPSLRNRFRDELRAYYAAHPKAMEPAPNLLPLRDSVRLSVGNVRNI